MTFRTAPGTGLPISRFASLAAAFVLAGCATTTPIGTLLDDPSHYDGNTVRIEGEVLGAAGAGIGNLGVGTYRVRDDTGTLTVISESSGPPRDGAVVRVKGIFEALFTFGSTSLAVLREQSRSRP